MKKLHAGHWLGLALFLVVPLAVVAPKGEVILLVFVALPLLARTISRGSYRQALRSPLVIVLTLLLLWGAASAVWALDPVAALHRAGTLALLAAAAIAVLTATDLLLDEERRVVRWAAVFGLIFGCALLVIELIAGLPFNSALRDSTEWIKPTILNGALSVTAILAWPAALIVRRHKGPWLAIVLMLLVVVVLVLGEGNSARVAFGLAAVTAALTLHWPATASRAVIVIAVAGILTAPLLPGSFLAPERWSETLSQTTDSVIHRLHIWHFSAERIAEKPIAGWGLDTSRIIPGGEVEVIHKGARMQLHPHNAALQIWLELGIPGALGLTAIVLIALLSARYLPREAKAASFATTAAALAIASLSFGIWQHWWLATLALAAVSVKIAADGAEPPPA